jgi:hypothetical protein
MCGCLRWDAVSFGEWRQFLLGLLDWRCPTTRSSGDAREVKDAAAQRARWADNTGTRIKDTAPALSAGHKRHVRDDSQQMFLAQCAG